MSQIASLLHGDFPQKYEWSPEYQLGVPLIDAQHKKLFFIFKSIVSACKGEKCSNAGVQVLEFMSDYMDYHFKAEEAFWELDPVIYATHRKAHYYFVKEVYKATGKVQNQEDISDELLEFLGSWLLDHVLGMDRDHFAELQEKGIIDLVGFSLEK
jgi:hemerythrin